MSEVNLNGYKGAVNPPVSYNIGVADEKVLCISLWWKERPPHTCTQTHTHKHKIAHPADTSVWPHSHLKPFHSLTVRPVFPPADVFWGQCFFEKTQRASARQEKLTSATLNRVFSRIPDVLLFKLHHWIFCSETVFCLIVNYWSVFTA